MDINQVKKIFKEQYNVEPTIIARAPGRVNLIGEHTDYNGGFVLPAAINKEIWVAAVPTGSSECVVYSDALKRETSFSLSKLSADKVVSWVKPIAGVAWAIQKETNYQLPGVKMVLISDLPIGAGLSSSAAVEMAPAVMWDTLAELALSPVQLAKLGQKCENEFMGLQSGIMDQTISAMGEEDSALLIDTRSMEATTVPIPADWAIVVCDTGKARTLASSKYNERRAECEQAVREIRVKYDLVNELRDVSPEILDALAGHMMGVPLMRARHVVTENERVMLMVEALKDSDSRLVGALMAASHESLKTDYVVSCDELDMMVESAMNSTHCVGVRMTGAGFGGACVALVRNEGVDEFVASTIEKYSKVSEFKPNLIPCKAVKGACVVQF